MLFISSSAKKLSCFTINSTSYFKLFSKWFLNAVLFDLTNDLIKMNSFWSCYYFQLVTFNDHSHCYNDLTKLLESVLVDARDIVFLRFRFLICVNYFQLLLEPIILEVWLIVCLELRFWFLFLFFPIKYPSLWGHVEDMLKTSSA